MGRSVLHLSLLALGPQQGQWETWAAFLHSQRLGAASDSLVFALAEGERPTEEKRPDPRERMGHCRPLSIQTTEGLAALPKEVPTLQS